MSKETPHSAAFCNSNRPFLRFTGGGTLGHRGRRGSERQCRERWPWWRMEAVPAPWRHWSRFWDNTNHSRMVLIENIKFGTKLKKNQEYYVIVRGLVYFWTELCVQWAICWSQTCLEGSRYSVLLSTFSRCRQVTNVAQRRSLFHWSARKFTSRDSMYYLTQHIFAAT